MKSARSRRVNAPGGNLTPIEWAVLAVIFGLLAAIVFINLRPADKQTAHEQAEADIAMLYQAVETYRLDLFAYPTPAQGLQALVTVPQGIPHADRYRKGGYLSRLPIDPWGHPYRYQIPGKRSQFDIYSLGADGRPGGNGENADFGVWK